MRRGAVQAGLLVALLATGCTGLPAPSAAPAVASPTVDQAESFTFDTRILSLHVGGGALWVVRRGDQGRATRMHRFVAGQELGRSDLGRGLVADAVGDPRGLWVATGTDEAVHLDVDTGAVDLRVRLADAEWIGGGDDHVVVAGPPAAGVDGTAVTVVDAASGVVTWQADVPTPDWDAVVDVAWADGLAWIAHFDLADPTAEVRGALAGLDDTGAVAVRHALELDSLHGVGGRVMGTSALLSARMPAEPAAVVVGPGDVVDAVRVGHADDLALRGAAATADALWVPLDVAGDDRVRVVEVAADGAPPRAVRLPVPPGEVLEDVAVAGDDLWYVTAGPDVGPDGDLPTTLWRLPGAAR